MSHQHFINFKALENELGDNFKKNEKNENLPFSDIKVLKFSQDNPFKFLYKTSYLADDFEEIDIYKNQVQKNTRTSVIALSVQERKEKIKNWTVKKAYNAPNPIAPNKKRDLMYLVDNNYVKRTYYEFYNSLRV
ncbi:unnamed protein product [Psylliodes chrysocephalus]|uniref:Uncharacterized protein n=1 Tax=Psylliodes chrysocephalus TaxID=3402493 RepID=A0A9P0G9T5_9CUCU|nr:unnamed protein product [Psylliodes chrysocephala]